MLTLHNMQVSGNCYKVRLAARQLGLALRLEDYPVNGGKTRTPEFLARNPNGRVPLLEYEDGRCLAESNAILFHLAEGSPLVPKDAWARAKMLEWMFFEQYSHEPYVAVARFILSEATPEAREKRLPSIPELQAKGNAALAVMDAHLARNDWFAGGAYGLADIALYAYTHAAEDGGFDLARYPSVEAWLKRVAGQPNYIPMSESW